MCIYIYVYIYICIYIYIYIAIYGLNIWIKYGLAIKTKAYKENGQLDD